VATTSFVDGLVRIIGPRPGPIHLQKRERQRGRDAVSCGEGLGRFGSLFGRREAESLEERGLDATMKLDPDIDRAAISGRSRSQKAGSNTPAAMGARWRCSRRPS
jgi:hypothetical protein